MSKIIPVPVRPAEKVSDIAQDRWHRRDRAEQPVMGTSEATGGTSA